MSEKSTGTAEFFSYFQIGKNRYLEKADGGIKFEYQKNHKIGNIRYHFGNCPDIDFHFVRGGSHGENAEIHL